ncbi:MAG: RNA polymerase sigma factor [Methylococcaceae bacterium]|nr:RNA polymerase sigma factor [Methylococcaceae bacterium]
MHTTQESPLLVSFIHHQNDLLKFLSFKLRCSETADDLVQETYIRIAKYSEPETIENPRAFFFHIANNLALDHLRKRAFEDTFTGEEIDSAMVASPEQEPAVTVNAIQQLECLERLIEELPPVRRQVFLLSRVEGKNYKTIAQECGISERTVENHVYKALKTLKTRFADYE